VNEMMAHDPHSPAGETRANRFAPSDQFEDAGTKARWRVYVLCAAAEVPLFFSPDKQGNGRAPILHCTNELRADNRRISGKRTGGLSGQISGRDAACCAEKSRSFPRLFERKESEEILHSLSSPVHGGSGARSASMGAPPSASPALGTSPASRGRKRETKKAPRGSAFLVSSKLPISARESRAGAAPRCW
jgi:hypothetical protein